MRPLSPRRRALQRILAILLGLTLGLAVAEVAVRLTGPALRPHLRNRVYFAEPDPLLGWRNRAGLAGPYGGEEFLTWVTINPAGQRGPFHPVERRPGTLRIAVLGDSQAWGDGVADAETFAARLDGGAVELLNFSAPGYGTDQQLLVLERVAAAYRPDIVVVAVFVGNDFSDNLSPGTYQYPKPFFTLDAADQLQLHGVPVQPPRWLHVLVELHRFAMRRSSLLNAIAAATRPPDRGAEQDPVEVRLWDTIYGAIPSETDRRGLAITVRLLREIIRRSREIGAEPVILILPESWQVGVAQRPRWRAQLRAQSADWRRPQKVLRRALASEDARVLDALPALTRATRRGAAVDAAPTYYKRWRHLNAHGHAVIARLLEHRLGLATWRGP